MKVVIDTGRRREIAQNSVSSASVLGMLVLGGAKLNAMAPTPNVSVFSVNVL